MGRKGGGYHSMWRREMDKEADLGAEALFVFAFSTLKIFLFIFILCVWVFCLRVCLSFMFIQ